MQAVRVHQTGGLDVLTFEKDVPVSDPKDNEVQVAVHAAGINFIDTYHRSGLYPMPLPFIPGREGAGFITKIGKDVSEFKVGDRVAFFAQGGAGSYAQLTNAPADKVFALPQDVDFKDAAGILLQGVTAHYLTHDTYPIQPNDWVLVQAGAGGTGGLVIEMAKLRGAKVITTVGSAEKAEIAKGLGADVVIDYTKQDFLEEVKKVTNNAGVKAVYDGVGASTWEKSMKCVARRGFLVLFGNASGPVPPVDPLLLTKQGSIYVTRPTMMDYIVTTEETRHRVSEVFQMLAHKKVHLRVAKAFPLDQVREAQAYLVSREAAGKVLLLPSQ